MLGQTFEDKKARAIKLLAEQDPMTLALALVEATESLSSALDNGCGNDVAVESILGNEINKAAKSTADERNYRTFARALEAGQQESILTAMMELGSICVHVDQLKETFPVEDVYDNSGDASRNFGMHGIEPDTRKLSIIYCASTED
ncbi:MAG: hypothetical protein GY833_12645 [Aestuariibacter sp.]|nr:hypothetical protein [Aestuariibacter sp.]|tara:strand:+ start:119274 stop:119711 length:438 start_codon:yes stop_codon:yes gene_type:complete